MVKTGHLGLGARKNPRDEIERRGYLPPAPYKLDVEIIRMSDLRARVTNDHLRSVHRIEFYMLICVTRGECAHTIDFQQILCKQGSFLVLRPSHTEQFDLEHDWDGWLVLFRPEFLFPLQSTQKSDDLDLVSILLSLPDHLALQELEYRMVTDVMSQMFDDSTNQASPTERNALIRYQLSALLLRIEILHRQQLLQKHASLLEAQRFNRFQQCVEQHFAKWRQVREYASALGCSEKSLTRATREVAGITAKTFIAARVNLEAKRLLVHTALPVAMIADSLGFDEPTNFIKFFKLEAGCTPAEFRRRHR